jgi:hypothetical protein
MSINKVSYQSSIDLNPIDRCLGKSGMNMHDSLEDCSESEKESSNRAIVQGFHLDEFWLITTSAKFGTLIPPRSWTFSRG